MLIKYRIHALAKDLKVSSREIIDYLTSKGEDLPKKHMTILNDTQLDIVFDHFSANKQAPSLVGYTEGKNTSTVSTPSNTSVIKPAQPTQENKTQPSPSVVNAPAGNKKPFSKPQTTQTTQSSPSTPHKSPTSTYQKPAPVQQKSNPVGTNPQQKSVAPAAAQNNTAGTNATPASAPRSASKRITVDTRSAQVDLDKYNQKYETIAGQNHSRMDNDRRKQKITQKSSQRARAQKSTRRVETESQRLERIQLEKARKQQLKITVPDEITISELASRLKVNVAVVIKKLMSLGIMAAMNESIDFDTASLVAIELGAKVEKEVVVTIEERLFQPEEEEKDENMEERNPIIVVMGHVDHGKTSLLDAIRNAHVTSTEAGGITQHIGAYQVKVGDKYMTFLDTPGHAAFTSMRARGAMVTDIAILVVAADDGIMPQTIEAINHAKAAGVSIIIAVNKMDKPDANPDRVKQELTEHGLVAEEWGGDTIIVPISAKEGTGLDSLLEMVQLTAEVKELKANPNRLAKGAVIEAYLDKGRGPVATVLVQNGTLKLGDPIIAGTAVGRVRSMLNDKGENIEFAGPSVPVEITGLGEVPSAGDIFNAVEDEKLARELTEQRKQDERESMFNQYKKVTLDNLFSQIAEGDIKDLSIIVKADVQGSAEAVKQSLEKITNEEVRVKVIHTGVGAINESDVMLANVSNAIIIGFNVRPEPMAEKAAEIDQVDMRMYRVIYDAIEDVEAAMKGMLAPKFRDVNIGRIEVRMVLKISNVGTVGGCYVLEGYVKRNAKIRVVRDGIVITEDEIDSLRRFKDDVKEVKSGYECGIGLVKFNDIKEGDIFEAYITEEYRPE